MQYQINTEKVVSREIISTTRDATNQAATKVSLFPWFGSVQRLLCFALLLLCWVPTQAAKASSNRTGPSAPINLSATAVSSSQINLAWQDTASNAQGYGIQMASSPSGPWTTLSKIASPSLTTYASTGLSAGQLCYFQVFAYNRYGTSYSSVASATTLGAVSCSYSLDGSGAAFQASGGSFSVSINTSAGCAWTISGVPSWISGLPSSGSGPATLNYSVAANTSPSSLSATLTIAGQSYTVTEAAGTSTCTYSLDSSGAAFQASGGSFSVSINTSAGCAWTISGVPSWISGLPSSGSGPATLNYTAAANGSSSSLSATLTIAGQSYSVSVAAATPTCTYSLSAPGASFGASGGGGSVTINTTTGCGWSVTGVPYWITGLPSSGSGPATLYYSVAANGGTTGLSATLSIAGQNYSVTEAGASPTCTYSLSVPSASFGAGGGSGSVTINTTAGCGWTITGVPSWITGLPASGSGPVTLNFTAGANTSLSTAQSATLSIAGQSFSVTVAPASDTTPPSVSMTSPANGATVSGTISLAANASDNVGVAKVQFYCDNGTLVGTATASPYSVSCNTTTMVNGSHYFYAVASDAAGNTAQSASCTVTVNNTTSSTPGQLQWVSTCLPQYGAVANGVKTDSHGNVVVVGQFYLSVDFGGGILTSSGANDVFIAKYSPQGTLLWAKAFGGSQYDAGCGVCIDQSDNIIVTGLFTGSANFGGATLYASGGALSMSVFAAKYSPSGTHVWSTNFGQTDSHATRAIGVDGSGNVFVAAGCYGTTTFTGGLSLSGYGGSDIVLAKFLGTSGALAWAKVWGGSSSDYPYDLAVDRLGDVVITGQLGWTCDINLGGGAICGNNIFVAKYSGADGTYRWARAINATSAGRGCAITTDPNTGNSIVTGFFMGSADFGGGAVSASNQAVFLAAYDPSGNYLWAETFGGTSTSSGMGTGITMDGAGNLDLVGQINAGSSLLFGPWPQAQWLTSDGNATLFASGFSISGNSAPVYRWSTAAGGTGANYANSIAFDSLNHALVAGSFQFTCNFNGVSVTGQQSSGASFVAQYTK